MLATSMFTQHSQRTQEHRRVPFTVSSEALYARGSGQRETRQCSVVLMLGHRHQWQPTLVLHRSGVSRPRALACVLNF